MNTKLFSPLRTGLLLLAMASAIGSQAAVSVYGVASSSGEFVTVRAYATITTTPVVSFSLRMFYNRNLLYVASASKNEVIWHLSDGSRNLPYMDPDSSRPGEILIVGARMEPGDPMGGVLGNGVLLGTAVFGRLDRDTPKFEVTIGRTGDYASFVTTTGVTLESLPGEVIFGGVSPTREDQDLDGLRDVWEIEHFNDIRLAFYSDDPDRDGVNNQGEEALGSDPNDRQSNLRMEIVRQGPTLRLQWTSFADRAYVIEYSDDFDRFVVLEAGIKATPPVNAYVLRPPMEGRGRFYRIRLQQ